MEREIALVTGQVYHVFTKSISGFKIFNNNSDFKRMLGVLRYYQQGKLPRSYSNFYRLTPKDNNLNDNSSSANIVDIIAFCLMPTHLHLILAQKEEKGIAVFMSNILNSYTRYFNLKHNRKGPLWQSRFKRVLVATDEQLLHLTRYVHLNPATAFLVEKPEEWHYSSYKEYLSQVPMGLTKFKRYIDDVNSVRYKVFVESRINYQRELSKIKHLLLEE